MRVVVTGGTGFVGKRLINRLRSNFHDVVALHSQNYDLTEKSAVRAMFNDLNPDYLVHLAAKCAGIIGNIKQPTEFFYHNAQMGQNLIWEAVKYNKLTKFLNVSTICAYPAEPPVPFCESNIFDGPPEPSNRPYAEAKRGVMIMGAAARQQYGLPFVTVLPTNLYGPNDSLDNHKSHVIPALCQRFILAQRNGQSSVQCLGTGEVSREFLYVDDCVDGMAKALMDYDSDEPCNLGSGEEVTIKELAYMIAAIVGFDGEILWDSTAPNGQSRRCLNVERAKTFGWQATTTLEEGLTKTITWVNSVL